MADDKVATEPQIDPKIEALIRKKVADEYRAKAKDEARSENEKRIYRLLAQVTPKIAEKFLDAGAARLTTEEVSDLVETNEDIQTDSSGHISVLALLQSVVWIATGKRLKGLRHPTSGQFGGFQLAAPTALVHKPKSEK